MEGIKTEKNSKITVVIPCYNQEKYISETLDSVLAQEFQDWSCIVVDDCSTDNSRSVVMEYVKRDSRIKYILQEKNGVSAARNRGINLADGEYILPLDGDDVISSNYMQLAMKTFEEAPEITLVYANAVKFGLENKKWRLDEYSFDKLKFGNSIYCSFFCRKADFDKVGGYDELMKRGFEDWELLLRLLNKDSIVHKLNEVCFYYRIKEVSHTTTSIKYKQEILDYIVKKNIDLYLGDTNPIVQAKKIRQAKKFSLIARFYLWLKYGKNKK